MNPPIKLEAYERFCEGIGVEPDGTVWSAADEDGMVWIILAERPDDIRVAVVGTTYVVYLSHETSRQLWEVLDDLEQN